MQLDHSSIVVSSTAAVGPATPALLTSTVSPPYSLRRSSNTVATSDGSEMSASVADAVG